MDRDPSQRPRFWLKDRYSPRQMDWVLFAVAVILAVLWTTKTPVREGWQWAAFVLLPFLTIPVLWRRSYPGPVVALLVGAVSASIAIGEQHVGSDPRVASAAGLVIGSYSAAMYGGRRTRLVSGVLAGIAFMAVLAIAFATRHELVLWPIHTTLIGYGVAWVVGDRTRTRRAYVAELEERALQLKRERDEQVKRAGEQERMRIARELHDVVAHNVSVIAVQAGAARATAQSSPDRAPESLAQAVDTLSIIERTARSTLGELRAVLGVLRKSPDEDAASARYGPQPTLEELDELVSQAREAGMQLEVRTEGDPRPLAAMIDLCAYRVIQEALTNVIKHAAAARTRILVRYAPADVLVSITNEGPEPAAAVTEGHGLLGMRERVALAGGELRVGPAPAGGFRVEARLPAPEEGGQAP